MRSTLHSKPKCLSNEQWLAYLEIKIKYGLIKITSLRQNCLSNDEYSGIIKVQNINKDGGIGSGNHSHKGIPGQVGGSAPSDSTVGLTNAIVEGRISTKLNVKKQSKHIKGTAAYQRAIKQGKLVSVITIGNSEVQELITRYSGKGHVYEMNGQFKETFEHTKPIGIHVNMKGKTSETKRGTIHYAKDGAHVVPASPKGGGK